MHDSKSIGDTTGVIITGIKVLEFLGQAHKFSFNMKLSVFALGFAAPTQRFEIRTFK